MLGRILPGGTVIAAAVKPTEVASRSQARTAQFAIGGIRRGLSGDEAQRYRSVPDQPMAWRGADLSTMFWALGTLFGRGVSQSARGDLLAWSETKTPPGEPESARGYTSRRELSLHVDLAQIVGLMCVRQARAEVRATTHRVSRCTKTSGPSGQICCRSSIAASRIIGAAKKLPASPKNSAAIARQTSQPAMTSRVAMANAAGWYHTQDSCGAG
jgi:hypothetical protein